MKAKGILINDNFELSISIKRDAEGKIVSGLVIGNILYQNQALILIINAGEVKTNPIVGVGIGDIVNDNDYLGWRRRIRQQMELDGQKVTKVSFSQNQKLEIDAKYSS